MSSNQVFKKNPCCQLDKSHWQISYIGSTECENLAYNQFRFSYFNIFMPNCLKKTFKLKFDSCLTNLLTGMQKLSIHLALVLKTSHLYRFHPFYLSISPVQWHKCQRFSWASCTSAMHAGSFDCLMASLILLQWTMAEGTVHTGSPAKFPTKLTEE